MGPQEPKDTQQAPKSTPCYESAGASWVLPGDLLAMEGGACKLRLRGAEPLRWTRYLMEGGTIHDMSLLTSIER